MSQLNNRTKNAKRSILSGLLNKILSILAPFIVKTIIIKKLGMEYLGLDNLFTSILQVLNLSELGLSTAIAYCMYEPLAKSQYDTVNALYSFFKKAYYAIGIIVFILGILIVPFLPRFISGDIPIDINLYVLYFVYLINSVLSFFLFAYKNVLLNAYQRLDVSNNILTVSRLIMYILQISSLFLFSNYYLYVIIMPLSTLLNNIMTSFYVDKMFPDIIPTGDLDSEHLVQIKYQVSGLFISKICVVSRNSFDSIIISSYLGLTMTAVYNNYYYIMNAIVAIMVIFTSSLVPIIGNSIAVESKEKNYYDFNIFNFIFMWIVGIATTCLIGLYQPFMRFWVGENGLLHDSTMILFCIYFFSLMIGSIRSAYTDAAGLWWQNRKRAIAEAMLNLVLNIVLGKTFGVNGIIFATIGTIIILNFGFSSKILFNHYFNEYKLSDYFVNSFIYFSTTLLSCLFAMIICSYVSSISISGLAFRLIICLIVSNLIFIICYHRMKLFADSIVYIKRLLKIYK